MADALYAESIGRTRRSQLAKRGKLALCYGTRPQVVKASVLAEELEADWEVVCLDTGQHYDWEMNGLHYQQLGVRPPDRFLEVRSGDHAQQTAAVLQAVSGALEMDRPDVVMVIGDTNSTLGAALAAAKMRIPVIHVEAGLRATDFQMAEEINRRVVDEISTVLCAPSISTAEYLRSRASAAQTVVFSGDVARDVLERARTRPGVPAKPWEAHGLQTPYVLATLHRAELTSKPEVLAGVVRGLGSLPYAVFFPAHPRTLKVLEQLDGFTMPKNVVVSTPVGYLDMVGWTQHAAAVVTDSGGLQREAYWLGVPCVTVRGESEWTETVAEGANVLLPPDTAPNLAEVLAKHPGRVSGWKGVAYGGGRAVHAVRDALRQRF